MQENDSSIYDRRRRRVIGQSQTGLMIGLAFVGFLVASVFVLGGANGPAGSDPLDGLQQPGPPDSPGRMLYIQYCSGCHGVGGDGNPAAEIPPLNSKGDAWQQPRADLIAHILDGGETMPELKGLVSPEDAALLIDTVQLWWTEEQVAAFEALNP